MNITLNTSLSFLSILRRTSFHIVVVCVKSFGTGAHEEDNEIVSVLFQNKIRYTLQI